MHTEWPATKRIVDPSLRESCTWLFYHLSKRLVVDHTGGLEQDTHDQRPSISITNLDECLVFAIWYETVEGSSQYEILGQIRAGSSIKGRSIVSKAFIDVDDLEECMTSTGKLSFDLVHPVALSGTKIITTEYSPGKRISP